MTKHTQGTWKVNLNDDGFINPVIENESQYVCILEGGSRKQQIANARLIAAAPELLGALENFVSAVENYDSLESVFENAKSIIAKAKGN